MPEWLTILPPLFAIVLAVWKREVVLALLAGIWLSESIIVAETNTTLEHLTGGWVVLTGPLWLLETAALGFEQTIVRIVEVFGGKGDTRVLIFGLVVGALLELMRASGGVSALVQRLTNAGLTKSKRQVGVLSSLIGMLIFMETNLSVLSAGVVSQKLYDKFKMSRARLAYIIDSTCAPISVLFLFFNAWGPYVAGLIDDYDVNVNSTIMGSVGFNFYALLTIALVWYTAITTKVYGPLKASELTHNVGETTDEQLEAPTRARYMLAPLLTMIFGMIFFMVYTGFNAIRAMETQPDLPDFILWRLAAVFREGSGSTSILMASSLAVLVAIVLTMKDKVYDLPKVSRVCYTGMSRLLPVVTVMLLSFAIGASCKALGTGPFVASVVGDFLPPILLAPLLFIAAGIIAFTTGTSWGTFAILVPVGIPLALTMGISPAFILSAILGGGVYGDHCSPISDTTIVSSLAAGCDHLEHVKTQLPYATVTGVGAILLYLISFPFVS